MSEVITNVCRALKNIEIRNIDSALSQIARKQEVEERDAWISQLIWEKAELQTRLKKMEVDLKVEEVRTKGAHKLIGLLEEHVRNTGEVVTKAQLYDEAVAKASGVTTLKLIHICVDYSTRMETILAEMRAPFTARNRFFRSIPVLLEKVPDLTEFPDLPLTEVLQNLQTLMTLRTNPKMTEPRGRQDPGFDARSKDAERTQPEEIRHQHRM